MQTTCFDIIRLDTTPQTTKRLHERIDTNNKGQILPLEFIKSDLMQFCSIYCIHRILEVMPVFTREIAVVKEAWAEPSGPCGSLVVPFILS